MLSLSFPSLRRSLSRCSRGAIGGAYFSLIKNVTFGNRPYRWWLLSERDFFRDGGPRNLDSEGKNADGIGIGPVQGGWTGLDGLPVRSRSGFASAHARTSLSGHYGVDTSHIWLLSPVRGGPSGGEVGRGGIDVRSPLSSPLPLTGERNLREVMGAARAERTFEGDPVTLKASAITLSAERQAD